MSGKRYILSSISHAHPKATQPRTAHRSAGDDGRLFSLAAPLAHRKLGQPSARAAVCSPPTSQDRAPSGHLDQALGYQLCAVPGHEDGATDRELVRADL